MSERGWIFASLTTRALNEDRRMSERGWIFASLTTRAIELRRLERAARLRFSKPNETADIWRGTANIVADVYAEAATLFEIRAAQYAPPPSPETE